jgi:hypothetical protein
MNAISTSIQKIVKEEADDYFVIILSDANIGQYNISPGTIAKGKTLVSFLQNVA